MHYFNSILNTTWKRLLAALVISAVIILAINTFAASSYDQTQKIQQESARGQKCQRWSHQQVNGDSRVTCTKWPTK